MVEVGDVVTLKTGSPKMVISKINWNGIAKLYRWEDEDDCCYLSSRCKGYNIERIPVTALEKVVT